MRILGVAFNLKPLVACCTRRAGLARTRRAVLVADWRSMLAARKRVDCILAVLPAFCA